jgi:putative ABC transport system permease protein
VLKNYFHIAWRNLLINNASTYVTIASLAIAVGIGFVIVLFIHFAFSMDSFHQKTDRIYMVKSILEGPNNSIDVWGTSPFPIATFSKNIPNVERTARISKRSAVLNYNNNTFNESVSFVDPDIINILTFSKIHGNFNDFFKLKLIISNTIAEKYFGKMNPIGKVLEVVVNGKKVSFTVAAVIQDFPKNSSFKLSIMIPIETLAGFDLIRLNEWKHFVSCTLLLIQSIEQIKETESALNDYVMIQNSANEQSPVQKFELEPLSTLSLNSYKIKGDISSGFGSDSGRSVMLFFGLFILVLACLNYVNISLSKSSGRVKEIGIRKVLGGGKRELVVQFIIENFVLTLLSSFVGLILALSFLLPAFENLFSVGLQPSFKDYKVYAMYLLAFSISISLISGLYPALYISSFKPAQIFKNAAISFKANKLGEGLLIAQLTIAGALIFISIAFMDNKSYLETKEWGYQPENLLVIRFKEQADFNTLRDEVSTFPEVESVGASKNHIGTSRNFMHLTQEGKFYKINAFDVGEGYISTLGLIIISGLPFNEGPSPHSNILVNETLFDQLAITSENKSLPISVEIDSIFYTITGVVKDFHYADFNSEIEATIIRYRPNDLRYLVVKSNSHKLRDKIRSFWLKQFIDQPYNAFYQKDIFFNYFNFIEGHSKTMSFLAIVSIILSISGLFGLISISLSAKLKEFAIRKVSGASAFELWKILNKNYFYFLLSSLILGCYVGLESVSYLFEEFYSYHIEPGYDIFLITNLLLLIGALVPMVLLINKLININPVEVLKNE